MSGFGEDMVMEARIEAYLRGELTGDDRTAFERDMLRDPALRAAVDLARRIDDRLRDLYSPPAAPASPALRPTPPAAPAAHRWVKIALGIAAMLAVAAGVHFSGILGPGPGGTRADAILTRFVRTGFEPAWVCKDDAEFIQYTRDKFGQPFTVAPAADVQVIGWDYCTGVLGDEAGVMLVKLGGDEKAIVIVDRTANDRPVEVDPASGLKVHRRKIGRVVLYEVSMREQAAVLPLVNKAE